MITLAGLDRNIAAAKHSLETVHQIMMAEKTQVAAFREANADLEPARGARIGNRRTVNLRLVKSHVGFCRERKAQGPDTGPGEFRPIPDEGTLTAWWQETKITLRLPIEDCRLQICKSSFAICNLQSAI